MTTSAAKRHARAAPGRIEALVAFQRERFRFVRARLDHIERSKPFGMARNLRQSRVDEEALAILDQGMADEAELGFHAGSLAIEHGIGIGGRGVGLVAPFLAPEVD